LGTDGTPALSPTRTVLDLVVEAVAQPARGGNQNLEAELARARLSVVSSNIRNTALGLPPRPLT